MFNIQKQGSSLLITSSDNTQFPYKDGKMSIPMNSITYVIDESNYIAFRSASNNDILFSANLDDIQINGSTVGKDDFILMFDSVANSTASGGGGSASAGVNSINGFQGDLTLKSVNGKNLIGSGDIEIEGGVTSVNGATGDVTIDIPENYITEVSYKGNNIITVDKDNNAKPAVLLATINGQTLIGGGNIEIEGGSAEGIIIDENENLIVGNNTTTNGSLSTLIGNNISNLYTSSVLIGQGVSNTVGDKSGLTINIANSLMADANSNIYIWKDRQVQKLQDLLNNTSGSEPNEYVKSIDSDSYGILWADKDGNTNKINLKTINGQGLVGDGDITIEGGGGSTAGVNKIILGTEDYGWNTYRGDVIVNAQLNDWGDEGKVYDITIGGIDNDGNQSNTVWFGIMNQDYSIKLEDGGGRLSIKINEWIGTQDEYNGLGEYDSNCTYYIIES